jgi:dihydroceramidase
MSESQIGYWVGRGRPAAVDWCEANYAVTPWVAEFWNTLSSLAIFAVGAFGLWTWWRARTTVERRFGTCYVSLAVIGLGSAAFHATLLRLPQALDELPMIVLSLACFYCLVTRDPETPSARRRAWALGLTGYGLLFTVAYFVIESYFVLFLASYAAVVAYVCIITWRLAFRGARDPRLRPLFWASVVAYIGGFSLFWIPERTLGCEHAFQGLQPHALFHLGGAVGPYAWVIFATVDRLARLGTPAILERGPIPHVAGAGAPT